ncbi:MAG: hypothetical protein FHK80_02250 [Azoarcus sp. PHD]|nr:MAG: hypothetical protein FHK80_02250 [Azoarcus sp. PHD]
MLSNTRNALGLALLLALGGAAPMPAFAQAPTAGTQRLSEQWDEKRATTLLDRAVAHIEAKGKDGVTDFSRQGSFVDGDLYVYALAHDGRFLASGGSSAALIGSKVTEQTDAGGKAFFREILDLAAAKGSGRVEYRWLNPVQNREEPKVTLFRKVGDVIVAVGFYSPRASAAQARDLLDRAADALAADASVALADFQRIGGKFTQDDLYVLVVNMEDGRFLAHGASPALIGRNGHDLRDPKGKAVITDMINIARRKGAGELDYVWRNPTTAKVESKHTYFRAVDGKLVGVGYYTR